MLNRINEVIDKTTDKVALKTLKLEVTADGADVVEVVNRYINEYDEKTFDTVNYDINLGYDRTLQEYKRIYGKLRPCSDPINYHKTNVKAKGSKKDIYEISFGTPGITITTKKQPDEKTKMRKFKEVA